MISDKPKAFSFRKTPATQTHVSNRVPAPQRKPLAKRAFTGLAGSPLASVTCIAVATKTPENTLTDLLVAQRAEADRLALEREWESILEDEGWEPGDDQPVLKSSRGRNRNGGPAQFQRYQFRLRTTGDRNARWDHGVDPAIFGSMSSFAQVRDSGLDSEGSTAELYSIGAKAEAEFNADTKAKTGASAVTIANVAQSMPKGFRTGVLSNSLMYADIPRESREKTAWIFSDVRLQYFVSRFVSDEALRGFNPNDTRTFKPFARALKVFVCLWLYFRVGKTSKATHDDPALARLRLWKSTNALKRYRCRVVQEGLKLFGSPADPKLEFEDYDPERVKATWVVVLRLYRSKLHIPEAVTGEAGNLAA